MLAVLSGDREREHYGLEIARSTRRPTGTVYPILSRLEEHGWVEGRWDLSEHVPRGPRRRYYRVTDTGQAAAGRAISRRRPAPPVEPAPVLPRLGGGPVTAAQLIREFAEDLRTLRIRAGSPSLRALGMTTYYSPGALSEAFSGRTLPSPALLAAVVRACGGDQHEWKCRRNLTEQGIKQGVRIPFDFEDFYPLGRTWVDQELERQALSPADREDAAQESLAITCEQWSGVRADENVRSWIQARARRCAISLRRQQSRSDALLTRMSALADDTAVPDVADTVVQRMVPWEMLNGVDRHTAQVALLRGDGYTARQIADFLGTSVSDVDLRLARLRRTVSRRWYVHSEGDVMIDYLRRLRVQAGNPSVRELATRTGYSHTTVHRVLSGAPGPRQQRLVSLLIKALGGSVKEAERWMGTPQRESFVAQPAERSGGDHGDVYARWALTEKLKHSGRTAEAIDLWRPAAESGDTEAMWVLADMLESAGRMDEAESWLSRSARRGDTAAARRLARRLEQDGRLHDAYVLWQTAMDHGDTGAVQENARLLVQLGHVEEACELLRRIASTGNRAAMRQLSQLLSESGRVEEACAIWLPSATAGSIPSMRELARLQEQAGAVQEAERWLLAAAVTDDPESIRSLADLQERLGARHKAKLWLRRLADRGDLRALASLSDLHEREGDPEAAHKMWLPLAEAGNRYAMWRLTGVLERAGRTEDAVRWKVRAASSDPSRVTGISETLDQKGEALLRRMAAAGDQFAPMALADLLIEAGRQDEAELALREAVDDGNEFAATALAELLRASGRHEAADAVMLAFRASGPTLRESD
ncbi:helix-turn-helix transcriptional regulator [Nonomuraea thailandensis]